MIAALGGTTKTAAFARKKSPQSITNAKNYGRFPRDTYVVLLDALAAIGCTAPPELWGMTTSKAARR